MARSALHQVGESLREHIVAGTGMPLENVLGGYDTIPESKGAFFASPQFVKAIMGRTIEGYATDLDQGPVVKTTKEWQTLWRIQWVYDGADLSMETFAMWIHSPPGQEVEQRRKFSIIEDSVQVINTPLEVGQAWQKRWTLELELCYLVTMIQPIGTIESANINIVEEVGHDQVETTVIQVARPQPS